jgi:Fe-S-cluster-containing dehydrogenase component
MNHTKSENYHISNDITGLTRAIDNNPENPVLYYERGWAHLQSKNMQDCEKDWDQALKLNPEFAEVFEAKALLYFLNGEIPFAERDVNRALEINPKLKDKLSHLQGLIKKEKENPGCALGKQQSHQQDEKKKDVNPRREFLKQASVIGAAAVVASTFAGCTPAVLKGEETDIRWGKIIDLKRCVGCKACSVACKAENHTPPGIAYHVVMESETGKFPYSKREFLPMPCMHCKNSSCIPICPVKATYTRSDGVVVVDYDKCIGCRYCIATCPYGSRSFDYGHYYSEDRSNPWESLPSPEYGQYRSRTNKKSPIGNVRKCTSCLHRIYNGIPPACAASCMGNAIHFGDLANPDAQCMVHGVNLQDMLARRHYRVLKEETGNAPRVYYLT